MGEKKMSEKNMGENFVKSIGEKRWVKNNPGWKRNMEEKETRVKKKHE